MLQLKVKIPDLSFLETHLESASTVTDLIQNLLARHKNHLLKSSGVSHLDHKEWSLTTIPFHTSQLQHWTKNDLSAVFKPINGTLILSDLTIDMSNHFFLFHVLTTTPLHCYCMPTMLAFSIKIPVWRTTKLESLLPTLLELLALPKRTETSGYDILYRLILHPTTRSHQSIETIDSLELIVDQEQTSWFDSIARPASMVGSWLSQPGSKSTITSYAERLKDRISAPIMCHSQFGDDSDVAGSNTLSGNLDTCAPTQQLSGAPVTMDKDPEFESLLDELQIQGAKRYTLYALSPRKRAALLAFQRGQSQSESHTEGSNHQTTMSRIGLRKLSFNSLPNDSLSAPLFQSSLSNKSNAENFVRMRSRSHSPVRLDMSQCPPKIEWTCSTSSIRSQHTGSSWLTWWHKPEDSSIDTSPGYFLSHLRKKNHKTRLLELTNLRVHLGTARASWLTNFIAAEGLESLAQIAKYRGHETVEVFSRQRLEVLKCFRIILNSEKGFQALTAKGIFIRAIVEVLEDMDIRPVVAALDILSGICATPHLSTHRQVFLALAKHNGSVREGRFTWLLDKLEKACEPKLRKSSESDQLSDLVRAILTLFNAMINAWPNVEDRVALRYELFGQWSGSRLEDLQGNSQDISAQVNLHKRSTQADREELKMCMTQSTLCCCREACGVAAVAHHPEVEPTVVATDGHHGRSTLAHTNLIHDPSLASTKEDENLKDKPWTGQTEKTPVHERHRDHENAYAPKNTICKDIPALSGICIKDKRLSMTSCPSDQDLHEIHRLEANREYQEHPLASPASVEDDLHCDNTISAMVAFTKEENSRPVDVKEVNFSSMDNSIVASPFQPHGGVLNRLSDSESIPREIPGSGTDRLSPIPELMRSGGGRSVFRDEVNTRTTLVPVSLPLPQALPPPPPPPPPPPLPSFTFVAPTDLNTVQLRKAPLSARSVYDRNAPRSKKVSLKPLFWDKLNIQDLDHSIWRVVHKKMDNALLQELMLTDFEKYFAREDLNLCKTKRSASARRGLSRSKISLIDLSKAKAIEVMLARVKISYDDLAKGLMLMDDTVLDSLDLLRNMQNNFPSPEDIALVKEYGGDSHLLGNAERYILRMCQVPWWKERLAGLIIRRTFLIEIAEISPDISVLQQACKEIMESTGLSTILALALTAGNILNASTFRGDAAGFRLNGLTKLGEVRSSTESKSGRTLLHYLLFVLKQKSSKAFNLRSELIHCVMAARLNSRAVLDNATALHESIVEVRGFIDLVGKSDCTEPEDCFVEQMSGFVEHAAPIIEVLMKRSEELADSMQNVIKYVGEAPTETRIEDICATLGTFLDLVDTAGEENSMLTTGNILRAKSGLQTTRSSSQSFDGTLRAMRAGMHGKEISRELRDRPTSRVFPPPFCSI